MVTALENWRLIGYLLGRQTLSVEMTPKEQALADDKMRAEIAKLIEETSKIRIERVLYPFVAGGAFFGATAALTAAIVKAFF